MYSIRRLRLPLAALSYAMAVCGVFAGEQTAFGQPEPPQLVDITKLVFERPEVQRQFERYDSAARRFAGDRFEHEPYAVHGSAVWAYWRKRPITHDVNWFPKGIPPAEDFHEIFIETELFPHIPRKGEAENPSKPPRARTATIGVTFVACDPDRWCVHWHIRPELGWGISFYRWNQKRLKVVIPFRPSKETTAKVVIPFRQYWVADATVNLLGGPREEDFHRHIRSKESLRDSYLADLAKLERAALELLEKHEAYRSVKRPWEPTRVAPGDCAEPPRPVPIERVPLTSEEEAAEAAKIKADFAARRRLMEENYAELYAALRRSFPLEECFDGLAKE